MMKCLAILFLYLAGGYCNEYLNFEESAYDIDKTSDLSDIVRQHRAPFTKNCGNPYFKPSINLENYIVGGTEANPHSYPWLVATYQLGQQRCGGAIINENWILTAGHCVNQGYSFLPMNVLAGAHDLTHSKTCQYIRVSKRILHEDYPRDNSDYVHDDIALLKLKTPLKFSSTVQPICLPDQGHAFKDGKMFVSAGWGRTTDHGKKSNVLRQFAVPKISDAVCSSKRFYENIFIGKEFCCGYDEGGKDACQCDSGGPLVYKSNGRWYQGGIISWGIGCAVKNQPGVYTYLPRYIDWIQRKIANN